MDWRSNLAALRITKRSNGTWRPAIFFASAGTCFIAIAACVRRSGLASYRSAALAYW